MLHVRILDLQLEWTIKSFNPIDENHHQIDEITAIISNVLIH